MFAPATLPWSCCTALLPSTGIWAESMRETANGTLRAAVAAPTPVTTTSSSRLTSSDNVKSTVWVPAEIVIGFATGL